MGEEGARLRINALVGANGCSPLIGMKFSQAQGTNHQVPLFISKK